MAIEIETTMKPLPGDSDVRLAIESRERD